MKKKKKKQVALDLGDEEQTETPSSASATAPAPAAEEDAPAPIQKKGDKFGNVEEEAPATEAVAGDGAELFGDLKKKKKKKKEIPLDLVRVLRRVSSGCAN
jgi:translation initiation factor 2 subunit 2